MRMPREPRSAPQDNDLGSAFRGMCARGSAYSGSEMCRRGLYGYDSEDRLYFNVEGGQVLVEGVLSVDVDEWLAHLRSARPVSDGSARPTD